MRLGHLITRNILPLESHCVPSSSNFFLLAFTIGDSEGDVNCRGIGVVIAVTEFGDGTGEDSGDELLEGARTFGDEDCEEDFGACAEEGTFCYEAEAGEIHVCAGEDACVCREGF